MEESARTDVRFCGDDELGYERSRTRLAPGEPLRMDDAYRLAHLPLVAPGHPRIVPARAGAYYDFGRHPRVVSLVLPVPWPALSASPAFRVLDGEVRAAPFAAKVAWDVVRRRRERLHATICGSLPVGEDAPSSLSEAQRRELRAVGPVAVELRGLFSGDVNVGRLYLRVYPQKRDGENLLRRVQRAMGRRETDLYVVGLYNLVDDLDVAETSALAALIDRWWNRPILRLHVSHLWMLWATDDLVLDGGVSEEAPLT